MILSPVPEHILELFEVADYSMQKLQLKYLGVLILLTSGISPSLSPPLEPHKFLIFADFSFWKLFVNY